MIKRRETKTILSRINYQLYDVICGINSCSCGSATAAACTDAASDFINICILFDGMHGGSTRIEEQEANARFYKAPGTRTMWK